MLRVASSTQERMFTARLVCGGRGGEGAMAGRAPVGTRPDPMPAVADQIPESNVSEQRRTRVLEVANRLGYRPNAMARSLASRRTKTVGVVLDDLRNPFFAEIAGGVEELASELGYQLLLGAGGRQARRERTALATLLEYRVDGVILVSPRMRAADIAAAASEVPVVTVGRHVRGVDADLVITDEHHGTALVLDHLIGLGHERIAHVDGGKGAGDPQRRTAFLRGMRAHRLGSKARVIAGDFTEEAGVAAARRLVGDTELPTAVFAANDMVAAGLLGGLDQAGCTAIAWARSPR